MAFNLIIQEGAASDTVEAYLFYENKAQGLGERFLDALQQKYDQIISNPEQFGLIYSDKEKTFRDVKLKGFPYLIYYNIVDKDVVVYMVHNTYKQHKY